MIQRIQSLFWFLSAVATGLLLFMPILEIEVASGENGVLYASAVKMVETGKVILPSFPLLTLIIVITGITLLIIVLFKKRMLQMRLTIYNMILMVGLIGLGYFYAKQGANDLEGTVRLGYFAIMPVIAFILSLLAWRGVRRDYLMLKAVERIR